MTSVLLTIGAALFVVFGGAAWWTGWRRKSWRKAAAALGVRFSEDNFWWEWSLEGQVRGCDVRVHNMRNKKQSTFYTSILVQPRPALPVDLKIRSEDIKTKALKLLGTDDMLSGDAEFDRAIWLDGAPLEVLSRLDARAREATRRVLGTRAARARVEGGAAHFEHRNLIGNGERIRRLVLDLVGWMDRLRVTVEDQPQALLRILESDPLPTVRDRCLDVLLAQSPAIVAQAVDIGMRDSDATVRVHAALAAGAAGCPILIEALDTADTTRAGAIFQALEVHDPVAAREQAARMLTAGSSPARPAAIETVGRLGMTAMVAHFEDCAADPACAAALVDAARLLGDPAVEPALLRVLPNAPAAVLDRAVDTLAHLGTRAAIAPLRALRGRVRKSAQVAIERIAEREAPGRGGGLSLLADASGALSTANARAGSLSAPQSEGDV